MSIIRRILIPPDVTASYRTVVRRYVERISALPGPDWPLAIENPIPPRRYARATETVILSGAKDLTRCAETLRCAQSDKGRSF
jgi:hypothetical protein